MGLPGMVLSAIEGAVGAVMYWAVTYQGTAFRLLTVGLILMIVGAFGFVGSGHCRHRRFSKSSRRRPALNELPSRRRQRKYEFGS